MSCLHYHNNELYIERINLKAIAKQFGTPCYVYSRTTLEQNWRSFDDALQDSPHQICYAVKANSNLSILHLLAQLNSGFDIVSVGELERVLKAGGDPKKIIFSGVGKQVYEIERAINAGIHCFDVESVSELERIQMIATRMNKIINIAFRVNPNIDPKTHEYIATGLKSNKFGIEWHEIISLYQQLTKMDALRLIGLACHIGSQMTALQPILLALDRLLALHKELKKLGANLTYIDIGGGLGITYHHEKPPKVKEYGEALQKKLGAYAAEIKTPLKIIIEPGRAIVGPAGILLTRIEYLKHNKDKNFAIIDAGMNDLLRPILYDAWQPILPVELRHEPEKIYEIVGPVCESTDLLGKKRKLVIHPSDLLAIDAVGAYGFSMSSNYNSRPRAAEVLVDQDNVHLIRRRETIHDMIALETIVGVHD